jgi:ribosome-associated protein|tara:strand:+ start:2526 stop:2747 length:222 start_codon:yes stop_codon:yes gene_type:complete
MQSQDFTLKTEYIDLSQLLKAAGLAMSGGEAKFFVTEGLVQVNGEPESRKRRKLRGGDVVVFNNEHKVCIITD